MERGRPTLYNEEEVRKKLQEYLESCTDKEYPVTDREGNIVDFKVRANIPTIEGFALFIGVNKTTIYEWESNQPSFSNDIAQLRQEQAKRLVNKGLSGEYNPTIAKVLLAKHGYRDSSDIDVTTKGDKINSTEAYKIAQEYEQKLKDTLT